ncbi:MAG: valine--tRNA ligase [Nitrospiraceae bacterium]|nr:valine--tRNA ligase [Nitrospiraceae bacterium]
MPEPESRKKSYEPQTIEQKWYDFWLEKGLFKPEVNPDGKPYCIVIPPPNVTGQLHMGHALNATLQDVLVRWKRMHGFRALWIPGTDHAGIATQNVVEREIAKEKKDRHQLGREEFINRVWKWRGEYGGRIIHQLKKMGASCDWSRERFTLDDGLSMAVRTVFVRLYEEGLIYRSTRLINWCPRCHTALSDLEVEHEEEEGILTYIKYPLEGGKGHLTVATTRPETMLGDTGVAVNPGDERYRELIGRKIDLPLTCRQIPIVGDTSVEMEVGTGAVKVTPAHDFNDEEIAKRQNPALPSMTVIGADGKMTGQAGPRYAGLDRYECRRLVVEDLRTQGLIEKEEKYGHSIGHCYRCKTVIEPLATPQWYVKIDPLAREAIKAVRERRVRIIPEGWENSYFSWMENIKDWCISRQIWWGHRIPVWYCGCGQTIASMETPEKCPRCQSTELKQDPDVLDTWFSSALWPFSTLGWPQMPEDMRAFYPTDALVTAFDILFFWVARMIMMGLKFMDDVPFRNVYIHALVRDEDGQKMSKSKGNVIDPLLIVDKYGADAFRFTLAAFAAQGRDIKFSEERVKGYRHFINKLWNAAKFISLNTEDRAVAAGREHVRDLPSLWILSRLANASEEINSALEEFRFNDAANRAYQFLWREFCDWYIELAKTGLEDEEQAPGVRWSLLYTLDGVLKLLHPFMPFVTEEIWQTLPEAFRDCPGKSVESIMTAAYPSGLPRDPEAEERMEAVIEAISGVRNIRGELNVQPGTRVKVLVNAGSEETAQTVLGHLSYIKRLAGADSIMVEKGLSSAPQKAAVNVMSRLEVYVPVEGLVDVKAELERLGKELRKTDEELSFCLRKLMDQDFVKRAPQQVVEKEKAKCQELEGRKANIADGINRLKSIFQEAEND